MALNQTTAPAQLLKQFWLDTFLTELRSNLVFADLALKAAHGKNEGTVVHWLSLADMSAAASISEGFDPTSYALSAGDVTATLTQYGGVVELSDVMKDTWIKGAMTQLMERVARNAALTIDTIIRNAVFTAGGTVQYAGTAVARNSIASDGSFDADIAEFREAAATLEAANVKRYNGGYYVGVIHPHVKYDIQGDTKWTDIVQYTTANIDRALKGEVGEAYGIRFMKTTQALAMDASGSASTDVYQSYVMGDEFFGVSEMYGTEIVVKDPLPSSTLNLKSSVGWKALFVAKQLNANSMIRLESGASLGT